MRIAVLNNSVPFVRGGAEFLAESLVTELVQRGHEAELVKIPLRWSTVDAVLESMFAATSIRIPEADRVIALKFPAYLVPHDHKVIWLLHQFRQVYDQWGTPLQGFVSGPGTERLRESIHRADNLAFDEASAIFCNSATTADRLSRYNGYPSEVLWAPHSQRETFRVGPFGNQVVALGRITSAKRQYLLIDALAQSSADVRLMIAGAPETPGDLDALDERVTLHGVADRVEVIPRFISDAEKIDLLSSCCAAAYIPFDEDSYGYVTAEAMLSGKPVITCSDSGGVLDLVTDGETGIVAEPTAASLATAIDRLAGGELGQTLGQKARERVEQANLSWSHAIERLLT